MQRGEIVPVKHCAASIHVVIDRDGIREGVKPHQGVNRVKIAGQNLSLEWIVIIKKKLFRSCVLICCYVNVMRLCCGL